MFNAMLYEYKWLRTKKNNNERNTFFFLFHLVVVQITAAAALNELHSNNVQFERVWNLRKWNLRVDRVEKKHKHKEDEQDIPP